VRLLITGSRGFVGGSLGRFAGRAGHEVLGIGRSSQIERDWPGSYVQADVAYTDLSIIIRDFVPDVVFHGAGAASVGLSFSSPLDDLRAAILTWANTLESVRRSGLTPLNVFPSSAAVYGNPSKLPISEDQPINPLSPYGFHKYSCELLAREYSECFGLDIVICRLFSVFGETQRRLLIWELYKQLVGPDCEVCLEGTGKESRDYLYMDDLAGAFLQLFESRLQGGKKSQFFTVNVASGRETEVLGLAEQLRDLVAPKKNIYCQGFERPGDPRRWCADISLLRSLIPSWQPQNLALNLAQCVDAWQSQ